MARTGNSRHLSLVYWWATECPRELFKWIMTVPRERWPTGGCVCAIKNVTEDGSTVGPFTKISSGCYVRAVPSNSASLFVTSH